MHAGRTFVGRRTSTHACAFLWIDHLGLGRLYAVLKTNRWAGIYPSNPSPKTPQAIPSIRLGSNCYLAAIVSCALNWSLAFVQSAHQLQFTIFYHQLLK
jgi:hypothetical protein